MKTPLINHDSMDDYQKHIDAHFVDDENEKLTGNNCPVCDYPTVYEFGLELCYYCGWSEEDEPEGYYEE